MIRHVDGCVNAVEEHEVPFNPVAECEVLDVDVSGSCGRFLGIAHCGATVVILVEESCGFLWDVEVPKYTAYIKDHFSSITGGHEFSFCA